MVPNGERGTTNSAFKMKRSWLYVTYDPDKVKYDWAAVQDAFKGEDPVSPIRCVANHC